MSPLNELLPEDTDGKEGQSEDVKGQSQRTLVEGSFGECELKNRGSDENSFGFDSVTSYLRLPFQLFH